MCKSLLQRPFLPNLLSHFLDIQLRDRRETGTVGLLVSSNGCNIGPVDLPNHQFREIRTLRDFHAISLENCHFLISSCRNASETKALGLVPFTCKPGSLHRNFEWQKTSSSSTTCCCLGSAHMRLAQQPDPCSTLPPSRRSRRMDPWSRKRD